MQILQTLHQQKIFETNEFSKTLDVKLGKIENNVELLEALSGKPRPHGEEISNTESTNKLEIAELKRRLLTLETSIDKDPSRALSVPLLRKDLDVLEAKINGDVVLLSHKVDQMYSVFLWMIGALISFLIWIFGKVFENVEINKLFGQAIIQIKRDEDLKTDAPKP